MKGILDNGHAEVAPHLDDNEECWYLPLFGVYHPQKPDKIRGVFDSSAKHSAKHEGISLNNVLLKGPDLTNSMLGVLLRFRKEEVAVTGDIEQMFYCFSVREEHRNFLRFIWYEDNDPNKRLIEYRMCKHVFGNSPSPAVATYGLRATVADYEDAFGNDVREFVERNFYVDDGITSVPTPAEAISLLSRTQKALSTAGIRLHKISSNSQDVLNAFPPDDLANDLKYVELGSDKLPVQRSLGLCWDLQSDSFTFKIAQQSKPYTRRGVLSTINSLHDPLGFLAPVTIQGKILLRDMVQGTTDWDEPLSNELRKSWECWESSLPDLNVLKIPRRIPTIRTGTQAELHIYSDASEKAISAVAYLRTIDRDESQHIGFVFGKSKVAPKHGHTIPRLELCAAVLGIEIAETLTDELSLPPACVVFHTDSRVVMGYITNRTRRFYVYVENRVSRILKFSKPEQWFYVPTEENPADVGTRYIPPALLEQSAWLQGPSQPELKRNGLLEKIQIFPLVTPEQDCEIRPDISVMKTSVQVSSHLGSARFSRFSNWRKLVIALSFLRHIAESFKRSGDHCNGWHKCEKHKIPATYVNTETFIITDIQREFYESEINHLKEKKPLPRNSSILSLSPFLDENGVLRVGGRIRRSELSVSEKNPILIPGRHHIATLITRHYHESVQHQGRHFTEGAIRAAGYWITGAKRLVSLLVHRCVKCRRLRGKTCHQKMADLPIDRLIPCPPFTFVGVDVFGPWNIITRRTRGGAATSKRWAVIFTCLVTRAIHLELIEAMSSSSFINAMMRFSAIRGKVKEFRSDRGTNFVGASSELGINVTDASMKDFLNKTESEWVFNPPHASHFGGVWERMIGVTRRILDAMLLNSNSLTHEVLSTFMAEVSAIVNARPLVPISTDAESPFILTPSILLTQKAGSQVESFQHLDVKDMYQAQWKQVQVLAERFWKRWRREYLPTIQSRRKWETETPNVKEGDVILLKDDRVARNDWPTGIVTHAFPSVDGLVRKVKLRVHNEGTLSQLIRPITEIVVLVSEDGTV